MPDTSAAPAATSAAAAPLTFPLQLIGPGGRVYTSFQLPTAPWHLGSPTYRTVTKTNISSWTF
jgi:hypothetical protein